jgi:hypothetical protein
MRLLKKALLLQMRLLELLLVRKLNRLSTYGLFISLTLGLRVCLRLHLCQSLRLCCCLSLSLRLRDGLRVCV